jgi:choline-sulfatase
MCETDLTPASEERIRAARRAYYGAISYVDDQFGRLRRVLHATGLANNTIVVIVSDHGEMLGERGLWYKMTFFEGAVRIPLVIHAPGRLEPRRVSQSISSMDLLPTFLDLTGCPPLPTPIEGRSLLPHLQGLGGHDEVVAEYLAEGALAPIVMIRRGRFKYVHSPADPDQLFDLEADPDELVNLAATEDGTSLAHAMRQEVERRWDLTGLHKEILESQRRRRLVFQALATGTLTPWDYQPTVNASRQYVRSHIELDTVEAMARFPSVREVGLGPISGD